MHTNMTWSTLLVCGLTVASPYTAQAKDFRCGAGDVQCLIGAIHASNANGKKNTIRLKAGTYALTTVDNFTDGPNGTPVITGKLTIEGAGADRTAIVGQADHGVELRLLHVAASGVVVLKDLTLRSGYVDGLTPGHFFGGAGIYSLGTLTLRDAAVKENLSLFALGAGIRSFGTLTITDSELVGNVSLPDGAGAVESAGSLQVTGSLIKHNYGDWVGGIAATGTAVIEHSSIVENGGHLGRGHCQLWHHGHHGQHHCAE